MLPSDFERMFLKCHLAVGRLKVLEALMLVLLALVVVSARASSSPSREVSDGGLSQVALDSCQWRRIRIGPGASPVVSFLSRQRWRGRRIFDRVCLGAEGQLGVNVSPWQVDGAVQILASSSFRAELWSAAKDSDSLFDTVLTQIVFVLPEIRRCPADSRCFWCGRSVSGREVHWQMDSDVDAWQAPLQCVDSVFEH